MAPRTIMQAPINLIFHFLQTKSRVEVWLYDNPHTRMQGQILGFDEYMNLVLVDAEEIHIKKKSKKPLGRILLKGDTVTMITAVPK